MDQQIQNSASEPHPSRNETVNGLWIGNQLSLLELLTLRSFTSMGYRFRLWLYDDLHQEIPAGVELCDANMVIPASDVYARNTADPMCGGVGKGSFGAPFSDLFRYKLLYMYGGWWTDMDVCLLKPLPSDQEWFFRNHNTLHVIGNVMKCPPGSVLMERTYSEVSQQCGPDTTDWLLPNRILNRNILEEDMGRYIYGGVSNNDIWRETSEMMRRITDVPESWLFIHWQNEELRVRNISKNIYIKNSVLGQMMFRYGLALQNSGWHDRLGYRIRLGFIGSGLRAIASKIGSS